MVDGNNSSLFLIFLCSSLQWPSAIGRCFISEEPAAEYRFFGLLLDAFRTGTGSRAARFEAPLFDVGRQPEKGFPRGSFPGEKSLSEVKEFVRGGSSEAKATLNPPGTSGFR